jgi:hypothetical protein
LSTQRVPSLGAITADGAAEFDRRKKEWKEELARQAQEKAKAEQDSKSISFINIYSSVYPNNCSKPLHMRETILNQRGEVVSKENGSTVYADWPWDVPGKHAFDLHETAESAREAAASAEAEDGKKGFISTIIHGTKEGKEMDKKFADSFSKIIARGKYVHSIVFHEVKPDKVEEYTKLVGDWYPKVALDEKNHVHLVGSWRTEVGDCDTFGKLQNHICIKHGTESFDQCTSGNTSAT